MTATATDFLVTHALDAYECGERVDTGTWTLTFPATACEQRVYAAAMIAGAHTILYAHDAEAARAFFRDVLELDAVDAGRGWLIFELPPGELACHPTSDPVGGVTELYLMCPDVEASRAELEGRGAEFVAPITDAGWGRLTRLTVPGFGELGLYEPRHPSPLAEFG